jgi:hypothetical protein
MKLGGTQAELGSRSSGNIQTSTTFICRESPFTLERSEDFKTGKNPVYRKYKEAACMTCLQNPVGLPSIEISSIWHLLIGNGMSY